MVAGSALSSRLNPEKEVEEEEGGLRLIETE